MTKILNVARASQIIGLGESSHGSGTEFNFKTELINQIVRANLNVPVIIYFEAYESACNEVNQLIHKPHSKKLERELRETIKELYNVWQCKEILALLLQLNTLIHYKNAEIQFIGIDYPDKESKQKLPLESMLGEREQLMAKNVENSYNPDAIHIVWAHNVHVGKYGENNAKSVSTYVPTFSMGYYINELYGSKYLPIAQTFVSGKFGAKRKNGNTIQEWETFNIEYPSNPKMLETQVHVEVTGKFTLLEELPEGVEYIRFLGYYFDPEKPEKYITRIEQNTFSMYVVHSESKATNRLYTV